MALVNLTSKFDLVGAFGEPDGPPVGAMNVQSGPAFTITGPGGQQPVERGLYPFNIPVNSGLHAGPNADQAGRSLVGPNYQYSYGNSSADVQFSGPLYDLDGEIPFATSGEITINPFGNQQLPYNQFGPSDGFY